MHNNKQEPIAPTKLFHSEGRPLKFRLNDATLVSDVNQTLSNLLSQTDKVKTRVVNVEVGVSKNTAKITAIASNPNLTKTVLAVTAYQSGVNYQIADQASYLGNVYSAIVASLGNLPTNTSYWALVGPQTLDNLTDGLAHRARTSGHSTYRPLSNCLTASDAGSSATITIASFTMRFSDADVSVNSGSISGLSYSTLYYVYYTDPDFAGGSVTFASTTTKETALSSNRLFIGSILTPASGAANTIGNNDGGTGAQIGGFGITRPSIVSGNGVTPTAAFDQNFSTAGTCGDSSVSMTPEIEVWSGFVNSIYATANISQTLKINSSLTKINGTSANTTGKLEYSLDGGSTWTTIFNLTGTTTRAVTTDPITLPVTQNLTLVQVRGTGQYTAGTATTVTLHVWEIWIEVQN